MVVRHIIVKFVLLLDGWDRELVPATDEPVDQREDKHETDNRTRPAATS